MTREEEISNAVDTIIPIPPLRDGRTYEQALMATGFEAGVKWADSHPKSPWISVEDDLPCNHEELMAKRLFSYEKETVHVLTLLPDGNIVIDFMIHNRGKWKWWSHHRPTHWFPIPEPPKE